MTMTTGYLFIFIFGILIGNFTTTIFYRLPRGIILYGFNRNTTQPPFCSKCKHVLKFYEYLPILSWVSTRGTCNYCHAPITLSYFYLEILGGLLAVICTLLYESNIEYYIIMFAFYMIAILAFFIAHEHGTAFKEITATLIFIGILYRTLNDQSIISWLSLLSLASIMSLYILKDNIDKIQNQQFVHLILPASIWLYSPWLLIFMIGTLGIFALKTNFYQRALILLILMIAATHSL